MTIGDPVQASVGQIDKIVRPTQMPAPWVQVIDPGGANVADNSGNDITDPDAQVITSAKHIFKVAKKGTQGVLRLQYDDGVSSISANIVVQAFGRYSSSEQWMRLLDLAGNIDMTLAIVIATDNHDGINKWTVPNLSSNVFDLMGCDEVLIAVQTLLNTDANDALALVQMKVI